VLNEFKAVSEMDNTFINLRVDGMSRHGKVTSAGTSRSICAPCTCVRSFGIQKLEKRVVELWIYEDTSSEPREKFGSVEQMYSAKVYIPTNLFEQAWDAALSDEPDTRQVNLHVLIDDEKTDYLPVISYSLDEVTKTKSNVPAKSSSASDTINVLVWIALVIYGSYGIAKYFNVL
jgi:hypothetical protein